jgi:hypothetical protein
MCMQDLDDEMLNMLEVTDKADEGRLYDGVLKLLDGTDQIEGTDCV